MGQAPRDPDQLARDILAGRVSIQDLAREQARRRAAAQAVPAAPVRPAPLPPPRVIPQQRIPVARPVQVAGPAQQRVVRLPPQPGRTNRPNPPVAPTSTGRKTAVKGPYAIGSLVSMQLSPAAKAAMPQSGSSGSNVSPAAAHRSRTQVMRKILSSRQGLRTLFLASEILNKPLALR